MNIKCQSKLNWPTSAFTSLLHVLLKLKNKEKNNERKTLYKRNRTKTTVTIKELKASYLYSLPPPINLRFQAGILTCGVV